MPTLPVVKPGQGTVLPLFDAICAWCQPDLVPEFRQLTGEEFDDDLTAFLVGEGPDKWKVFRYAELRDQLLGELLDRLRAGVLVATGCDLRAPIDAPPSEIPAERWTRVSLNLRASSATFDGVEITGIKLRIAEGAEAESFSSEAPILHPAASATPAVRLTLRKASKEALLEGRPLKLTAQPFNLLLILAEAAWTGMSTVSHGKIRDRLVANDASENVVAEMVRTLREQIKDQFGPGIDPKQLIQNRSRLGYLLEIDPEEIQILA
jgi:DNA-binding response OmpR family regulator